MFNEAFESIHTSDVKQVGMALDNVRLVEIDYDAIEKRAIAQIQENIRLRKEWENRAKAS